MISSVTKTHESYVKAMKRQRYKFFGENEHSTAKLCLWTKKSIKGEGVCYKQKFYGIQSHRCLQMTPCMYCQLRCIFCWRTWEHEPFKLPEKWDSPKELIEESIRAQRVLLAGLGGIPERIDKKKYKEAQNPKHVAISLDGEPTLYPYLSDLIKEYHKKNMTTFLVTNGTTPEVLESLEELPTQLYISLYGPDKETHKKVNAPLTKDSWEKILKTLELLPSLDTRKVIRLTLVKELNMIKPEKFAELIKIAKPDFLESKAYMFIGGSRQRLKIENMPYYEDVKEFSLELNKHLGYDFIDEQPISRVILLSSGKKDPKIKFD